MVKSMLTNLIDRQSDVGLTPNCSPFGMMRCLHDGDLWMRLMIYLQEHCKMM